MSTRDDRTVRDDFREPDTRARPYDSAAPASSAPLMKDGRRVRRIDCSASAEQRASRDSSGVGDESITPRNA